MLADATPPDAVAWLSSTDQAALPFIGVDDLDRPAGAAPVTPRVPRAFVALAEIVACHRGGAKWNLLYRLLWRVIREGRQVLEQDSNGDVHAVTTMAAQVRRDEHKMQAFVRFTPVSDPTGQRSVAWYEPDHLIVPRAARFFADRLASMHWSILTPDLSAHWNGTALSFTEGVPAPAGAAAGEIEELWRVYYEAVFNPARVNPNAMSREMPARRWRTSRTAC